MAVWALLLAAAAAGPPAPPKPAAIAFDLAKAPTAESNERCGKGTAEEILVCGKTTDRRVKPLDEAKFKERPVRASLGVGNGMKLAAEAKKAEVGGFTSPRAMITFSIPLGPGKKE